MLHDCGYVYVVELRCVDYALRYVYVILHRTYVVVALGGYFTAFVVYALICCLRYRVTFAGIAALYARWITPFTLRLQLVTGRRPTR